MKITIPKWLHFLIAKIPEWIYLPNIMPSKFIRRVIAAVWFILFILVWQTQPFELIPKPLEVLATYPLLLKQGLFYHLMVSFKMFLEALGIATAFSLSFAYISRFALGYPVASFVGLLRFLGTTGLVFLFQITLGGGHILKLTILIFAITVFYTVGMVSVVWSIPKEQFDDARTLKFGEWHVLYEVVIRGTVSQAFVLLLQNMAMGILMLTVVEGLVRSEGGIGTLLLLHDKSFDIPAVWAINFALLLVAAILQLTAMYFKRKICKWEETV